MAKKMVRFDWAMKKILRHKANFDSAGFAKMIRKRIRLNQGTNFTLLKCQSWIFQP
jgi:hypothetical protein